MATTDTAIPFYIERITLLAGIATPIIAPITCQSCTIGNATGGNLLVSTDDQFVDHYRTIADNFEWVIWMPRQDSGQFRQGKVAFYLQSAGGGVAVLSWA